MRVRHNLPGVVRKNAVQTQRERGTLERNRQLIERVAAGEPCATVGRELGMTKQRAHQVLHSKYPGGVSV